MDIVATALDNSTCGHFVREFHEYVGVTAVAARVDGTAEQIRSPFGVEYVFRPHEIEDAIHYRITPATAQVGASLAATAFRAEIGIDLENVAPAIQLQRYDEDTGLGEPVTGEFLTVDFFTASGCPRWPASADFLGPFATPTFFRLVTSERY